MLGVNAGYPLFSLTNTNFIKEIYTNEKPFSQLSATLLNLFSSFRKKSWINLQNFDTFVLRTS